MTVFISKSVEGNLTLNLIVIKIVHCLRVFSKRKLFTMHIIKL